MLKEINYLALYISSLVLMALLLAAANISYQTPSYWLILALTWVIAQVQYLRGRYRTMLYFLEMDTSLYQRYRRLWQQASADDNDPLA
jgi:type IV secretory pathway VirB3-like protein